MGNGGHVMGDNTHLDIGHHRFMAEHKMVGLQKEENVGAQEAVLGIIITDVGPRLYTYV